MYGHHQFDSTSKRVEFSVLTNVYEKVKYIEVFPFLIVMSLSLRTFIKHTRRSQEWLWMCVNYTNKYQYEIMSTQGEVVESIKCSIYFVTLLHRDQRRMTHFSHENPCLNLNSLVLCFTNTKHTHHTEQTDQFSVSHKRMAGLPKKKCSFWLGMSYNINLTHISHLGSQECVSSEQF